MRPPHDTIDIRGDELSKSRVRVGWALVVAGAVAVATSCGGSSNGCSPAPSPSPTPGGTTTITITNNVASPLTLTVRAGTQVTFVNNDCRVHNMLSDPHPEHTDCLELNQVGFLSPGQSRQSGNLNTVRTCGFHDHDAFQVTTLIGRIIIQ